MPVCDAFVGGFEIDPCRPHLCQVCERPRSEHAGNGMKIKDLKLGATGRFQRGQAAADDEGELRMALAADHANALVRIEFGKPIAWLGLPVREARQLAGLLVEKADEVERRKA